MTTMGRQGPLQDEIAAWVAGVWAEQGASMELRHVTIPADADRATLEAAITALSVRKAAAVIPSTAAEMQADIDVLTDRWAALHAAV